ncbi:DUF2281 domain-containing protein [Leptothermofonsia sichuanensis E412]|uniref:DUF2281 domain-containing protein n=1 Tax=Leptothermofonsia sichuanensis TaxID=2917832 RepID=UPI001CA70212|nr:DUF2281 domain-containing protein [Leptothermofonsia sichuanensis]QZZ19847.1 DUF2281 domain-containing protein [Leptothermofonsia sichuanensis E412]
MQLSDAQTISPKLVELIQSKVQTLPRDQQQAALDFLKFLRQKNEPHQPRKSLWERIDEAVERIPDEAWDSSPTDGSYQHDHYLYGTPKREQ